MRSLLRAVTAVAILLPCVHAVEFKLPKDNPVVSFTLPDGWNPEASDGGVEALSPNGQLYLAFAFVDSESVGTFLEGALAFLERNGVKVDHDTLDQRELKLNGMDVVEVAWKGTDAGGPCDVSLDLIGVTESNGLMFLYWAPPGADEHYAREMAAIISSIQPVTE